MATNWEERFRAWAAPPGKTEQQRCDNAESAIRNAIAASEALGKRDIRIFTQGSYRNNTNVKQDSDVDIGVLCTNTFFYDLPTGKTAETFGIQPASYHYDQFKNDVEEALVDYFGASAVERGDKAFDVHETSYHVEADVAAFFDHRRYKESGEFLEGVELRTDKERKRIINWPEQHYANGVEKNTSSGRRYKSVVRILKAISNEMVEKGIAAGNVPGFLVECLVWNVPNNKFQHASYTEDVREAVRYIYLNTNDVDSCNEWGEVSELKYLFRGPQKWTREQANAFALAVWHYADLGN